MLKTWPPFCANIAFELWSTREGDVVGGRQLSHHAGGDDPDEGRHVRVTFNGVAVDMPCSAAGQDTCTLAEFKRAFASLCVRDFAAEGAADDTDAAVHAAAAAKRPAFNT
jgi:hypothetical protein